MSAKSGWEGHAQLVLPSKFEFDLKIGSGQVCIIIKGFFLKNRIRRKQEGSSKGTIVIQSCF